MSDSTRSTTVRYETSAQEQTSVVRTRTICTLKGARSDLPKQGIFLTVWSETVLQEVPHFDRSLPVAGSSLLLRCFMLPVWQVIGRVSMDPLPRRCWSRWCRLLVLCGFLGPGSGCRQERTEAFGTLLASGVQRLVALQVAEEDVGRLGWSHGEVDVLRLQDVGVSGPAPGVADVRERDLDGVSCGRGSLSEAVGCPAEAFRGAVPRSLAGRM